MKESCPDLTNLESAEIREAFDVDRQLAALRNKAELFDPADITPREFCDFYIEVAKKLRSHFPPASTHSTSFNAHKHYRLPRTNKN